MGSIGNDNLVEIMIMVTVVVVVVVNYRYASQTNVVDILFKIAIASKIKSHKTN